MSSTAPRSRPTMADVAARAGVSKMTVSRVVNGRAGVSASMHARVQAAIEALGYVPSHRGRSLAVGRTRLLGMLVLDVVSEWVWPLIRGAGREAEVRGYQLLLRTTGMGEVASFDVRQPSLASDLFDGLIIVSWRVPLAFARQLARRRFPVVLVDAFQRPRRIDWVSSEDRRGAYQATRHLLELGHRRITFISGGREPYLARERLAGFQAAMEEARLMGRIVHGDFTRQSGYQHAIDLLQRNHCPTAIFAANDLMAIGVLDAAKELGVEVPGRLSVFGFDDIQSASRTSPALTTMARPYDEMGAAAVVRVVEAVEAPDDARRVSQIDLPTRLVIRASTGAPHNDEL